MLALQSCPLFPRRTTEPGKRIKYFSRFPSSPWLESKQRAGSCPPGKFCRELRHGLDSALDKTKGKTGKNPVDRRGRLSGFVKKKQNQFNPTTAKKTRKKLRGEHEAPRRCKRPFLPRKKLPWRSRYPHLTSAPQKKAPKQSEGIEIRHFKPSRGDAQQGPCCR